MKQINEFKGRLATAIEKVTPEGWEGHDWLEESDTAIAMARAAHGKPGATRERCRQVRRLIESRLEEACKDLVWFESFRKTRQEIGRAHV